MLINSKMSFLQGWFPHSQLYLAFKVTSDCVQRDEEAKKSFVTSNIDLCPLSYFLSVLCPVE